MAGRAGQLRVLCFCLQALVEAATGAILWPVLFWWRREKPLVVAQETAFNRRVMQRMEALLRWYVPSPWAPFGCSQTVFAQHNPAPRHPYNRRENVCTDDGVELHLVWKEQGGMPDDAPLVIVLHGIAGCSNSKVARNTTDMAMDRGWRSVVYVRRGHGDSSLLPAEDVDRQLQQQQQLPQQVSADDVEVSVAHLGAAAPDGALLCKGFPMHADVDDMVAVVRHVQAAFPRAPKLLVGFSCGANAVVKYLGTQGKDSPFVAAASICNGHELVPLTMEFLRRPVANALMAQSLQYLLQLRVADVRRICEARNISLDFGRLLSTCDVREFERLLMLPLYKQFADIDDYYRFNSCHKCFTDVAVPLLTMATRDDPLIRPDLANYAIEAAKHNPNVLSVTTNTGGHLGWLTGWGGRWWQQDVLFAYLEAALEQHRA